MMIYRKVHHAEARAFLDSSFQRAPEACSQDPVFYKENEDFDFKRFSSKMVFLQLLHVLALKSPSHNKNKFWHVIPGSQQEHDL